MRFASKSSFAVGAAALVLAAVLPSRAVTIHVPDDQPTIQAGIDAASYGDTVLVACGTYYEHDLIMKSGICLTSGTGEADCVTIDAQQQGRVFYCDGVSSETRFEGLTITGGLAPGPNPEDCGGGIYCVDSYPTFASLVITGNEATGSDWNRGGGGVFCYDSSPVFTDCVFYDNVAGFGGAVHCLGCYRPVFTNCAFIDNYTPPTGGQGGGMYLYYTYMPVLTDCVFSGNFAGHTGGGYSGAYHSSATMTDCLFSSNTATVRGGAARIHNSLPQMTGCAFLNNAAPDGAALHCDYGASVHVTRGTFSGSMAEGEGAVVSCYRNSHPVLDRTIIAFSPSGQVAYCDVNSDMVLACCDVYGNEGGDWVGCIADQYGINGNMSGDPLFCGDLNQEEPYTLHADSPCAPENNPECGLIGAWGVGCGWTATEDVSWGAIKAMFR